MKNNSFTLIEVLFAVVILALTLSVTLGISAQAKADLIRAKERWLIQHSLEKATEYFLLTSPNDLKLPDNLISGRFHANCEVNIVNEGLPEFADVEDYRGWQLGVYTINLIGETGDVLGQQIVHKLIPKEIEF